MPEVSAALKNVYFDSAASPFLYNERVFSTVLDVLGPDKILFATDYPLLSHTRLLKQVQHQSWPEDVNNKVLGGNAKRLLGI